MIKPIEIKYKSTLHFAINSIQFSLQLYILILLILSIMQNQKLKRTTKTSPFITKLHQMLEDPENAHLISWGHNSSTFIVHRPFIFSSTLLPRYFRHKNYSSFLRQLNLYNFTKLRSEPESNVFHHPLFQRGDFQKHLLIKRIDQNVSQKQQEVEEVNQNENEMYPEGAKLEDKIKVIKKRQKNMREACQKMIHENTQVLSDNYIFKATLEDESSNDRIILDRISAFMMHHYQDSQLEYCDSDMIKGLLKFLEHNDWEALFATRPTNAITEFFKIIETHELRGVVKWISSVFGGERKKKNYTIVRKNNIFSEIAERHQGQSDLLSILD